MTTPSRLNSLKPSSIDILPPQKMYFTEPQSSILSYTMFIFCSFCCDPACLLVSQNRQKAVFHPPSSAVQQSSSTVLSVPEKQDGDGGRTNNTEDWSPAQMLAGKSVATKLHFDLPPVSADSLHSECSVGLYSINPPL